MDLPSSAVSGVRIHGISSAVPRSERPVADAASIFGEEEVNRIMQSSGIRQRHIGENGLCSSDLCQAAAQRLLEELGWDKKSIGALIFVSQTPDYILPATSCALHGRLGLSPACAALDINLGCSGYIYGLWTASLMAAAGRRVLLLVGDTIPRLVSPLDRATALLFGDGGTATALGPDSSAPPIHFELGTDGNGERNLIVPAGGCRLPSSAETAVRTEREGGNQRSEQDLFMDGAEIFAFTLTRVPAMIKNILAQAAWTADDVDSFVFHQANRFMLQQLAKRMKLPPEKLVLAMEDYGNTSSASIPLALTTHLRQPLRERSQRLVLAGFGVGYSWGAASVELGPLCMPELVVV